MRRTLLLTVIFPEIVDYLGECVRSILEQSDQQYDWLIINDGITNLPVRKEFPTRVIWKDMQENHTPAEIRYWGIRYALVNDYEILIFADADDYFSPNRIELSKKNLVKSDFVYNELSLIDDSGNELKNNVLQQLGVSPHMESIHSLLDNNIIGLSNSSLNLKCANDVYIPKEIIAVDWWLYSILVLNGKKGELSAGAITYYRQTANNTVGMREKLDPSRLLKGIVVKQIHYKNLREYALNNRRDEHYALFNKKYNEMIELEEAVSEENFRTQYIQTVNKKFDLLYQGWWSEILSLDKWRQYAE